MAKRAVELERKAIYLDTLGYGYYLIGRNEEARSLLEEALADAPAEGGRRKSKNTCVWC